MVAGGKHCMHSRHPIDAKPTVCLVQVDFWSSIYVDMLCTRTNGKKILSKYMCNERKILMVRLRSELCHCFDSSDRECIDWISDCCFSPVRLRLGKSDLVLFYSLFGKKNKRKKKQNKNASAKKRRTTDCWMPLNKYKNTNSLFTCSFVFNELNFCAILNVFPGFHGLFHGRWHLTLFGCEQKKKHNKFLCFLCRAIARTVF